MSRLIVLAFAVGILRQLWAAGVAGWPEATLAIAIVLALPILNALEQSSPHDVLSIAERMLSRFGEGSVRGVAGLYPTEPSKHDDHRDDALQTLANETGMTIRVCHFPPGTSKWNKVEHRLFSFISSNWRGEPLRDDETIVQLIAKTTTAKGLTVTCRLDRRRYPLGRKVTNVELAAVNLKPDVFHGDWNYAIRPHRL